MKNENFKLRVIKVREVLNKNNFQDSIEHGSQLNEETIDSSLAKFNSEYSKNEKPNSFGDFNNWANALSTIMKSEKPTNWGDFNNWSQWADR